MEVHKPLSARVQLNSFPPPKKVSWWKRLFLREGDVWEQRICDWGHWEPEVLGRWIWCKNRWIKVYTD